MGKDVFSEEEAFKMLLGAEKKNGQMRKRASALSLDTSAVFTST